MFAVAEMHDEKTQLAAQTLQWSPERRATMHFEHTKHLRRRRLSTDILETFPHDADVD